MKKCFFFLKYIFINKYFWRNDSWDPKDNNIIDVAAFLKKKLGDNGGKMPPFWEVFGLKKLLIMAVIGWLASGVFLVNDGKGEQAVILRFGKVVRLANAGLNYSLPYPFETYIKERVHKARTFSVGISNAESLRLLKSNGSNFALKSSNGRKGTYFLNTVRKSSVAVNSNSIDQAFMLTRDFNVLNCSMSVLWSINNLENYLFKVRDPEGTLQLLAEAVLRAVIAQNIMDIALTKGKVTIQYEVQERLQKIVDEYNLGILIRRVELQNVEEPLPVRSAFREVENARQDRQKIINLANAAAIKNITLAQGEAKKIVIAAQAYKQQVIEETTGEYQRYKSILQGLKLSPKINRKRLWLEMMEQVFASANNKVLLPGKDIANILPLLPLNNITKNSSKPKQQIMKKYNISNMESDTVKKILAQVRKKPDSN